MKKKIRRRRRRKIRTAIFAGVFIGIGILAAGPFIADKLGELDIYAVSKTPEIFYGKSGAADEIYEGESGSNGSDEVSVNVDLTSLHSPCAILVDVKTGKVLAENNGDEKIYPASLTKIMTAILTVENTEDMSRTITMPGEIYSELYTQNASMAGFQPGEEVSMEDLVYGMLLPSGAECCAACAREIAGSEENFVDMMNEKARELGMYNTCFTNTTGLQDPGHYTTVRDMSLLLRYALQNDEFREIFTSKRHSVQPTRQHPDGFTFYSTLFTSLNENEIKNGYILGGKTGYTDEAGLCLASLAEVNGREYILVTAGAEGDHLTEQYNILDAIDVYGRIGEQ